MADKNNKTKIFKSLSFWVFIFIGAILISSYLSNREKIEEITYSEFKSKLRGQKIKKVKVADEKITGTYMDASGNTVEFKTITVNDPDLVKELQEAGVIYEGKVSEGWFKMLIFNFGPILLFIIIWFIIINQMRSGGKGAMKFGKSKAKLNIKSKEKKDITFDDVAGAVESKEELEEIIEFLQNPKKFTKLGAEIPKGVLLYGAPGTGKTLLAARENKKKINMHHLEEAVDRVIAGPERKSRVISEEEKRKIAYHESGHTLVALNLKYADPVHKVSILARGPALGYTLQLPLEDKYLTSQEEIMDKLSVLLGGRTSEEIIFNSKTTGAQNDLRIATELTYKLVTEFGMSEELGPLAFQKDRENIFLGKELSKGREYSEKTAELIDEGVGKIIEKAHKKARSILEENKDKLVKLAEKLIIKEIIEADEIKEIVDIDYKTHKSKKSAETGKSRSKKTTGKKKPEKKKEQKNNKDKTQEEKDKNNEEKSD